MASKAKRKRTYEEISVENQYLRRQRRASGFWLFMTTFVRWFGLCVIGYFAWKISQALAGQSTIAAVEVKADISFGEKAVEWMPFILGAGGVMYGIAQNKLRKWTNVRLTKRITELEIKIDPARSTSLLTEYGETRDSDHE